jgi:two-component system, NtrC family, sensor histidine kinase AtoS
VTSPPPTILYTQDADLARRVKAFLRATAQVRRVSEPNRLEPVLQQTGPALLLIDLRAQESFDLLEQVRKLYPTTLLIALGTPKSDPMREAEEIGVYAAEDLQLDRAHFKALVTRAFDLLRVMEENQELRHQTSRESAPDLSTQLEVTPSHQPPATLPLLRFPRVFRSFDNVDVLLNNVVEAIVDAASVTRVGIFSRIRQGDRYRLRAGVRCLPETGELEFGERDPLVRWFELHAHVVCRDYIGQIADQSQRTLLRRALDSFGAEVIVPLHTRARIIGWLFFGHRITGQAFAYSELESLMILAEHVSTVLENALLYEEVTVQKTLAETLLKSIPPGIVATDESGVIRWFNPTAEQVLGVSREEVLNRPIEYASKDLAAVMRDALDATENLPAKHWVDPHTQRSLSVEARKLTDQSSSLGAVAVVQDLTMENNLRQQQELLERSAFWTDLAASMSHEIRNPLVAIKTFAQLLPERFDDADFRREFNKIVVQEIDRLDKIITQINDFAHPPELVMKPLDLRGTLRQAVELAKSRLSANGVAIEATVATDLPKVWGDETALTDALAHLVTNAAEATSGAQRGRVTLVAKPISQGEESNAVLVTVQDNGGGISPNLRDKVFSPFCTTKARGMGLGLPIVKRTIFDHHGRLHIDSTPKGTVVSVMLPATPRKN